ncbi:MAG: hypothetical protein KDE59_24765 [Anaerolineales bacterium]|nr:hypothetical protein [Anaerolineales bacterium]MCB0006914.1 hypothetical protein [Anaerolineales bacterium]MCB0011735.1 hypothetical protein [Anaerolineales bacterium]MCB0027969.1 hypothetical protein [Anaerolineales bacterium]MCB8959791.1 hypothetical protein [Ardenticatenales bacterium]
MNWKSKYLLAGTLIGALAGLGTAYLMARTAEERGEGPPEIKTVDALRASVGLIGVVRAIAALGDK